MGLEGSISESAFLVNESRARNVGISRDRYAHLWVSDATRARWDEFAREVYPHDEIELGVRNRFFLERIGAAIDGGRVAAFLNLAAGFISYPFLVDGPCRFVQVDLPHVMAYKRDRVERWRREGKLPAREVVLLAADLNDDGSLDAIEPRIAEAMGGGASFASRFGHDDTVYNLLDEARVRSIPAYRVLELTDVQEQEQAYAGTSFLADREAVLPEHYVVLERT